jgi:hypothetical protein
MMAEFRLTIGPVVVAREVSTQVLAAYTDAFLTQRGGDATGNVEAKAGAMLDAMLDMVKETVDEATVQERRLKAARDARREAAAKGWS